MEFDDDDDDLYGDIAFPENFIFGQNIQTQNIIDENGFKEIAHKTLSKRSDNLLNQIEKETISIHSYFLEKMKAFPNIFEKYFITLDQVYNYLESISIPNKCECAKIIDNVPGWKCHDCSKYENSIYCSNCYINSKELHKGHKMKFLYSSSGMCDCGDPDSLYTFCPEHCGPYIDQKKIDEYIEKTFPKNILDNLKVFLDDLFMRFTKYLLLTEKCKLFYNEILEESNKKEEEKYDILFLKNNCVTVFQNFLTFLFKITEKNLGMLHLIASYLLKNNLPAENADEQSLTTHSCINLEKDSINILYPIKNENENFFSSLSFTGQNRHSCQCPFLRLFLSNWRDNVKPFGKDETQNEKLLMSFSHNLPLRGACAIMCFFLNKEIIFNYNEDDVIRTRNQYFIEDILALIAKKTNLYERIYEFLYFYLKKVLTSKKSKDLFGGFKQKVLEKVMDKTLLYMYDIKYFTKPKVRVLMYPKIIIQKRLIDIAELFHNQMEFKSIVPHPSFQEKKYCYELINLEIYLINIINVSFLFTDWNNFNIVKELFDYFLEKFKNLRKIGKDEFSYHISVYRMFGCFLNFFCFNNALNNKSNNGIISAIEIIKTKLFKSKEEMNNTINQILNEYYKMLGFIIGIKNEYFNYYDLSNYAFIYYNDQRQLKYDLVLLKYLLSMTEQKINLEDILRMSQIENSYSFFYELLQRKTDITPTEKPANTSFSFFGIFKNIYNIYNKITKKGDNEMDKDKSTLQWKRVLVSFISLIKDDTSLLWDILNYFKETISLKTKNVLFDSIKENENIMHDCKNMLKENIVQVIIASGNLLDIKDIKKGINEFFFVIFKEQEFFNILDELTVNKMNGEKKEYYLKDSSLKYLDMNYYSSPLVESKAEKYITDFKKDSFKMYNSYYYNPSPLFFDFYLKVYEAILLNVENINFFIKIMKSLLDPENKTLTLKSIRKDILPVILNYISILGSINSKSFIEFKKNNENLINEIFNILNNSININKENKMLDNELIENIMYTKKELKKYKNIIEYYKGDLSKLDEKNYNTNIYFNELTNKDKNENRIEVNEINEIEEVNKKNKVKDMKSNLRNKMKKKIDKFANKAAKNKDMKNIIESKISKDDNSIIKEEENEIMCFYCRNPIYLKKFDVPYAKIGLIFDDYFYYNCFKSTINSELNSIIPNNVENRKDLINSIIKNGKIKKEKTSRITSCGHYFHMHCLIKGKLSTHVFKCPLCEKNQNILIPALTNFYELDNNLKSYELKDILSKDKTINNNKIIDNVIFKDIIIQFIKDSIMVEVYKKDNSLNYNILLEGINIKYQSYINFLINLFYSNGTTFHKNQQIDLIQNLILSIRYLVNINFIKIEEVIESIHKNIEILIEGPTINDNIFEDFETMFYNNIFDKLLFSFSILLNHKEFNKLNQYLLNLILPYMSFLFYLRNLISGNNFYYSRDKINEKINIEDFKQYLNSNNEQMTNYLYQFLQKLFIINILTDYSFVLNYNINELSLEKLFSILNMDELYQSLSKNEKGEIIFTDLFEKLSKIKLNENYISLDYNKRFDLMINNAKKKNQKKSLIKAELICQFVPFKFKLIDLDTNIFDMAEKYLFKKCCICDDYTKYYYICLICGEKVCNTKICDKILKHADSCGGGSGIFMYLSTTSLCLVKCKSTKRNNLYPLYVNESGVGPNEYEIGNEFNLSQEKYNNALKTYISDDFH